MSLTTIAYNINLYFLPIIIVLGVIGNVLSILIFTRPTLRRSCSVYFLVGSFNGLIVLLFGALTRWLSVAFALDPTRTSIHFCHFRSYVVYVIYNLAPYFTACITIDRFCSSCTNANIRRLSSHIRISYFVIPIIVLMTAIAYIHMTFKFTILNTICRPESGFYADFFPFFTTGYYFIAIFTVVIFGLGTSYNIRAQRKRVQPMMVRSTAVERRRIKGDNQLLLMLLAQVISYAFLALPYHISLIVAAIKPTLSVDPIFQFIQNLTILTLNLSQAINFYIFTLTANLYRKELLNIFRRVTNQYFGSQNIQSIDHATNTAAH